MTDSERIDVRQSRIALSRASRGRWDAEAALIRAKKRELEAQAALDAALGPLGVGGRGETGGGGDGEGGADGAN